MSTLCAMTRRDLLRRPSTRLALFASAALVSLIPYLPAPGASGRDQTRLTLELGTTTIVLIVQIFAGTAAVHAASTDADRGISAELRASPFSALRLTIERCGGILQAAAVALLSLSAVAAVGWYLAGIAVEQLLPMTPAVLSGLAGAAAFAGFGLFVGSRMRADTATLIVVGAPWVAPMLTALNAPSAVTTIVGSILPPATGPIHARPAAFGHAPTPVADMLSILATLIQATAWCGLAATGFTGTARKPARSP